MAIFNSKLLDDLSLPEGIPNFRKTPYGCSFVNLYHQGLLRIRLVGVAAVGVRPPAIENPLWAHHAHWLSGALGLKCWICRVNN